jgi:hypothetical protein
VVGTAVGLSLLPDLDALWVRARQHRQGTVGHNNHHTLLTHTPLFYLIAAALLSCWASWQSVVFFLVVTLGHLMLDSWATDDGIMWLYPFRRKQYALLQRPIHAGGLHGKEFYKRYYRLWHFFVAESAFMMGGPDRDDVRRCCSVWHEPIHWNQTLPPAVLQLSCTVETMADKASTRNRTQVAAQVGSRQAVSFGD